MDNKQKQIEQILGNTIMNQINDLSKWFSQDEDRYHRFKDNLRERYHKAMGDIDYWEIGYESFINIYGHDTLYSQPG